MPDQFWRLSLAEFNLLCKHHAKKEREGRYCAWLSGRCNAMAQSKEGLEAFDDLFPEDLGEASRPLDDEELEEECRMKGLKMPD